jgi:hypothetical protein
MLILSKNWLVENDALLNSAKMMITSIPHGSNALTSVAYDIYNILSPLGANKETATTEVTVR